MGGTHGFANMPTKKASIWSGIQGAGGDMTLPGLEDSTSWASGPAWPGRFSGTPCRGSGPSAALCRKEGKRFETPTP